MFIINTHKFLLMPDKTYEEFETSFLLLWPLIRKKLGVKTCIFYQEFGSKEITLKLLVPRDIGLLKLCEIDKILTPLMDIAANIHSIQKIFP